MKIPRTLDYRLQAESRTGFNPSCAMHSIALNNVGLKSNILKIPPKGGTPKVFNINIEQRN